MVPQRYRFRLGQGPVSRLTLRVHVTQARSRNIRQWITSSLLGLNMSDLIQQSMTYSHTLAGDAAFRNAAGVLGASL